jgi:hypothetical protein
MASTTFSNNQPGRYYVNPGLMIGRGDDFEQLADRHLTDTVKVDMDGGQVRLVIIYGIMVIKPDKRDILRDAIAHYTEGVHGAKRGQVVPTKYGLGVRPACQHFPHGPIATIGLPVPIQTATGIQPRSNKGLLPSLPAFFGFPGFRGTHDVANFLIAMLDEVFGCQLSAHAVIDRNYMGALARSGEGKHNGDRTRAPGSIDPFMAIPNFRHSPDNAISAAMGKEAKVFNGAIFRGKGTEAGGIPMPPAFAVDPADHFHQGGVLQGKGDNVEGAGMAGDQALGDQIGLIAELLDRLKDALPILFGDGGLIGEDLRCGSNGNMSTPGNILDGNH